MCKISTSWLLIKLVFVIRPTKRTSLAQGLFRWVLAQGRSPHASGSPQNTSGPVGIPLKKGAPHAPGNKSSPSDEG